MISPIGMGCTTDISQNIVMNIIIKFKKDGHKDKTYLLFAQIQVERNVANL